MLMGGGLNDVWRSSDQGKSRIQSTESAEWVGRTSHTSVALPDGSVVLMGGTNGTRYFNDVWRSTDQGVTWTQMTASAPWTGRESATSVALPDGSIVLMGGTGKWPTVYNDVWRLETAASYEQNPAHTYHEEGSYQVASQVTNGYAVSSIQKPEYVTVGPESHWVYVPLLLRNVP
ncbi:MAG: hypothetical protein JXM73_26525 [Anaerolineae bacterium]|nr:hypothetical protein [Anaerolineae bacterium]